MNFQLRPAFILGLAFVSAFTPANAATKDDKKSVVPVKRPAVRVDASPLEAKTGIVMSYADVVEPVQKAVVSIYSTKFLHERVNPLVRQLFPNMPESEERKQEGLGSGVIVSADGYILTNNHVVEGADELKVSLADDREFVAKVIGTDPKTDIAVVKIDAANLPTVALADSDKIRVGDVVFAVGNPLGVGQTVTMGIVSAKNRNVEILKEAGGYEDFIQTDAAINMGNSGGALIDAKGRLIGVNSAILSPSRGSIGIGFAVPVNLAASIMNSLVETGTVSRGYLGVRTDNVTGDVAEQLGLPKDTKGVVVTDIYPNSPAEKIGLKRSDVILGINDHGVSTTDELRLLISQTAPGTATKLKIMRDSKERTMDVTLDKLTEKPNELFAGVNVKELKALASEERRKLLLEPGVSGVVVSDVADDSPYRERLAPDMVIVEINRTAATDVTIARSLVQPGRNLLLIFYRGGYRYLSLTVRAE